MKTHFGIFFLILTLLISRVLNAQSTIGINLLSGFLINHNKEMQQMKAHVAGFEIRKQLIGERTAKPFKNVAFGYTFIFLYMGKPNILGNVLGFIPHFESNLIKQENYQLRIRYGVGIGYISKPFSFPNNTKNTAIGSNLNGSMQFMITHDYKITQQLIFNSSIGLTHFSNGNFKKPNLGINTPHIGIGLHYIPQKKLKTKMRVNIANQDKNNWRIMMGVASKQATIDDKKRLYIYAISAEYTLQRKPGLNFRFGTDFCLDYSYPYQLFEPSSLTNVKLKQIAEHAFRVGYEWRVGKIGAIADIGVYTIKPLPVKRKYYFSVGFNYYATARFNAFVKLKTHLSVADYFMWGIGYRIYGKK